MPHPILAIDQSTTSTKALLLHANGQIETLAGISHQQIYPRQNWVEQDPIELLENIKALIDQAGKISAIGLGNQGESCLAWNSETKKPVSHIIVWQDNRSQDTVEQLKSEGAEKITLERAGLHLDSYFSATKFAWMLDNIPECKTLLEKRKLRIGTTDSFFLDCLTGEFVTDSTTASRTSLMNIKTGEWDTDLCKLFNVPMSIMAEIKPTSGYFGKVQTKYGFVPITASVVDQQAALFGHGCRSLGDTKITFGTGVFALAVTGDQIVQSAESGMLATIAWSRNNQQVTYAIDGGVYCASSAIEWAKKLGLFNNYNEINRFKFDSAIERGLVFVPALTGLACPHWDRSAAGLWIGLNLDTTKHDMVQSILEGIAFRTAEVVSVMNQLLTIGDSITIDGGMSVNAYFCQFLANTLKRTINVHSMSELTALGVAQLADIEGKITAERPDFIIYKPQNQPEAFTTQFNRAVEKSKKWHN
jgi:glycerol kinase